MGLDALHASIGTITVTGIASSNEGLRVGFSLAEPSLDDEVCLTMRDTTGWTVLERRIPVRDFAWADPSNNDHFELSLDLSMLSSQLDLFFKEGQTEQHFEVHAELRSGSRFSCLSDPWLVSVRNPKASKRELSRTSEVSQLRDPSHHRGLRLWSGEARALFPGAGLQAGWLRKSSTAAAEVESRNGFAVDRNRDGRFDSFVTLSVDGRPFHCPLNAQHQFEPFGASQGAAIATAGLGGIVDQEAVDPFCHGIVGGACRTYDDAALHHTHEGNTQYYRPISGVHRYYRWAASEIDRRDIDCRFFHGAAAVTGPFDIGISQYVSGSLAQLLGGVGGELADFAEEVNKRLLDDSLMDMMRHILVYGHFDHKTGIDLDLAILNIEQTNVEGYLERLRQEDPAKYGRVIGNFNDILNGRIAGLHGFIRSARAMIRSELGHERIVYTDKRHRIIIGTELIRQLRQEYPVTAHPRFVGFSQPGLTIAATQEPPPMVTIALPDGPAPSRIPLPTPPLFAQRLFTMKAN